MMTVIILETGESAELEDSYARRLIEQGKAIYASGGTPDRPPQGETVDLEEMDGMIARAKTMLSIVAKSGDYNPAVLSAIAASGHADRIYDIGDEIVIPWTDYSGDDPVTYQYPFVVTHFGDVQDENDMLHRNAMWLMAKYAEPIQIPFDAAESITVNLTQEPNAVEGWYYWGAGATGSTRTPIEVEPGDALPTTYYAIYKTGITNKYTINMNVILYGYNRWSKSAIRQWLNSNAAKNAGWWTSQHLGDVAPSATVTNKPGWLYGFTDEWKAIFKKAKICTAASNPADDGVIDVTYDTFFLPSLEEIYGVPEIKNAEGRYWEYWKNVTELAEPSDDANDARKIPSIANTSGSAMNIRLRSNTLADAYYTKILTSGGRVSNDNASSSRNCQPAFVLY